MIVASPVKNSIRNAEQLTAGSGSNCHVTIPLTMSDGIFVYDCICYRIEYFCNENVLNTRQFRWPNLFSRMVSLGLYQPFTPCFSESVLCYTHRVVLLHPLVVAT